MADTATRKRHRAAAGVPSMPSDAVVPAAAMLATISAIAPDGTVLVTLAERPPVPALLSQQVTPEQLRQALGSATPVLVLALDGDPTRPVIIGVLASSIRRPATATVDGRRVDLTGQDEVVLTCGKASITLTREGRIILRGSHLAASSTGLNRITGGSVQIN
jgi:hypothetical protein